MAFYPSCLPTAIGSLPHLNPQDGVDLVLRYLPEIPTWPQLPNASYLESMYLQYSSSMPFVHLDSAKERMHLDLSCDIYGELERFYAHILNDELDYFAIGGEYASGLAVFMDRLWRRRPEGIVMLKGQVTGPISFGLMITDDRKRSILYHEEVFDAVLKSLVMKARWQVKLLRRLGPKVIIFVDEPYLSSFGSAFINLSREQVLQYLGEVIEAVHQEGALAGVHCCGNTDWTLLMDARADIINFDACEYFQGMTLYIDPLKDFLKNGGNLAWGIVPTSAQVEKTTADELLASFQEKVNLLAKRGISKDMLYQQSLLTPSCGMGTLTVGTAERVLSLLFEVSQKARSRIQVKKVKKTG